MAFTGPMLEGGHWLWKARGEDGVEVRFAGRGTGGIPEGSREGILARIEPEPLPLAWPKQVHSAAVLPAAAGECGEGDAVFTGKRGLALGVVTADCVPIVLAGPGGLAAVHAGWRGIVSHIVAATLQNVDRPKEWTAWIGPAIGPCCYEVGEEVAEQVVAASHSGVASRPNGPEGKPYLDLHEAARHQLAAGGVGRVEILRACTRCDAERLYSYRREGRGAGRNLALIWRR
jgi:YfiH family protein